MNRTTIRHERNRLSLTDELKLYDDVNGLSKKGNLLKIGKLLSVSSRTYDEIPNNGWNMSEMEIEGRMLNIYYEIPQFYFLKLTTLVISRMYYETT